MDANPLPTIETMSLHKLPEWRAFSKKLIKKKENEEEWRRMQFELFKKEDEEAHWHEPKPEPEGEWCFNGDSRGYDGLCAASAFVPPDMSATRHTMSANEVVYVVCNSQCLSII